MRRCPRCGRLVRLKVKGGIAKHSYLPTGAEQFIKCSFKRRQGY